MRPVPTGVEGSAPLPASSPDEGLRSILYAVASFFVPGLGQMLNGQVVKGFVVLGAAVLTCCGLGLVSVAAAVDAFMIAERRRRGEPVDEWQFF
jgi:hypothetical protein